MSSNPPPVLAPVLRPAVSRYARGKRLKASAEALAHLIEREAVMGMLEGWRAWRARRFAAKADRDELAALRLLLVEVLSDLARRAPDPTGYLASRRAAIGVALSEGCSEL